MNELQIMNIDGVECYEKQGTAYLRLETVARGLGFTTVAKSGNEVVRWNVVYNYLKSFGVATSCNARSYAKRCPNYIPENIFYRLAMKAKNEVAEAFQAKIADEIIPSIRKHGAYLSPEALEAAATDPSYLPQLVAALKSETDKRLALEAKIQSDAAKVMLVESACREPVTVERFADFLRQNTTIKATGEKLFNYLRKNGYLIAPYDFPAEDSPYFEVSESVTSFSSGYVYIHKSLKITTEGQLFFLDKLLNR